MSKLEGKVAVITGGASGIGEATVRLFIEEGAKVLIADIQDDKGLRMANEIGASYLHTDVSQEADVRAAIERAVEKFGRLDCMFNNAGMGGVSGSIESIPVEGFDRTMAVLLRGVFLGMKHAAPYMRKQGSGSIINTASVAGIRTGFGPHIYSAAKAAVIHLTRSVAMELGEHGIRVNCICPGGIPTPIFQGGKELSPEKLESLKRLFKDLQPLRRSGLTEDIAKAALWLASDDSSFVTGQPIVVDGGSTIGKKMGRVSGFLQTNKIRA